MTRIKSLLLVLSKPVLTHMLTLKYLVVKVMVVAVVHCRWGRFAGLRSGFHEVGLGVSVLGESYWLTLPQGDSSEKNGLITLKKASLCLISVPFMNILPSNPPKATTSIFPSSSVSNT